MLDTQLIFDGTAPNTGVAITVTRDSTNVIDMLVARDMGIGDVLELHVLTTQAFTAAGAATLTVDFQASADNVTYYSLLLSNVYPKAELIAGSPIFRYEWPINQELNAASGILKAPGRYYKLVYTVATGPFTAGKVFSYVTAHQDRNQTNAYPANYTTGN